MGHFEIEFRGPVDRFVSRNRPAPSALTAPLYARLMTNDPIRYFKTSREIIRFAVMVHIRMPLSLRNIEDQLHERGINLYQKNVRLWVDRFGQIFAGKIRLKRASYMPQHTQWQWHLDEVFVKINGVQHYL